MASFIHVNCWWIYDGAKFTTTGRDYLGVTDTDAVFWSASGFCFGLELVTGRTVFSIYATYECLSVWRFGLEVRTFVN